MKTENPRAPQAGGTTASQTAVAGRQHARLNAKASPSDAGKAEGGRQPEKPPHPLDMTPSELRDVVSAMSWMALDLAQHLHFTNTMLKEELRPEAYEQATAMAYELSSFPYDGPTLERTHPAGLVVFGEKGLEL